MSVRSTTDLGAPASPPDPDDGGRGGLSAGRVIALVAIFAVLGGALAFGLLRDRSSGSTSSASPSVPTTTATGPTASVTAVAPAQPPAIVNTGEDWDAIVRSMVAFNDWLYLHPRPELLDTVVLPSAPSYADTKLGLTNLATKGWRYDPPRAPLTVEIVRLNSRVNASTAAVFVRFGPAPQYRVVDPSGAQVASQPATTVGNSVIWTLSKQADGKWYLADVDAL